MKGVKQVDEGVERKRVGDNQRKRNQVLETTRKWKSEHFTAEFYGFLLCWGNCVWYYRNEKVFLSVVSFLKLRFVLIGQTPASEGRLHSIAVAVSVVRKRVWMRR
jgi:hypothetical protein